MTTLPRPRRDEPDERALVRAMIVSRDLVERIAERHAPSDFRDANLGAIFAALLAAGHADSLDEVAGTLAPDALRALQDITESGDAHPPEASDVTLSLARFAARRIESRIEEIRAAMGIVHAEAQTALMRERIELEIELRRLVPIRSPRSNRKS